MIPSGRGRRGQTVFGGDVPAAQTVPDAAGIKPMVPDTRHAEQVSGYKTEVGDSVWLARPSLVLPKRFPELRVPGRHKRQAIKGRSRFRNRAHKLVDRAGLRVAARSPTSSA